MNSSTGIGVAFALFAQSPWMSIMMTMTLYRKRLFITRHLISTVFMTGKTPYFLFSENNNVHNADNIMLATCMHNYDNNDADVGGYIIVGDLHATK